MQNALRDAARQDDKQGVLAMAKKANDLYRQQQEIQKRADQRYTNRLCLACCAIHGITDVCSYALGIVARRGNWGRSRVPGGCWVKVGVGGTDQLLSQNRLQ